MDSSKERSTWRLNQVSMELVIMPLATKKRTPEGTRANPIKAMTSLVLNLLPIILFLRSK